MAERIHLVISHDDKYAIVNALAFYDRYHNSDEKFDDDEQEQWRICFREDNRGADVVDKLATKIARSF